MRTISGVFESIWKKITSYGRSVPKVAVRYYYNAQYEPFPPFLYPWGDVAARNDGLICVPIITEGLDNFREDFLSVK